MHCDHSRFVYNLAHNLYQFGTLETYGSASTRKRKDGTVYTHQKRRPTRPLPNLTEQCRQLTQARQANPWLAEGSSSVQQQALRDYDRAMSNFYKGTHGHPSTRKKFINESFRVVGNINIRKLNRRYAEVLIPKAGWLKFRFTHSTLPKARSFRVTLDRAGRWHVAFAIKPDPLPAPDTDSTIGIDRGITITAALSNGEKLHCPQLSRRERAQLKKHQRRASLAPKNSPRKSREHALANRIRAKETDRRKDWVEKTSTDLARSFDTIKFEDLRIKNMTASAKGTIDNPGKNVRQKAGLNRAILAQGWGTLYVRTNQKAPGRVEKVLAANTSLRCSDCGWIDKNSRNSQAEFVCTFCGFTCNADTNASINIEVATPLTRAGATAEGRPETPRASVNQQRTRTLAAGIPALQGGEDVNDKSGDSAE